MDLFAVYEDTRALTNGVSSENSLNLFEKVAKIRNKNLFYYRGDLETGLLYFLSLKSSVEQ